MAFANASIRLPKKSSRSQDTASTFHSFKQNDASVETTSVDSATVGEASSKGLADETSSLDDNASGIDSAPASSQEVQRLSASNDNLTDIPERYQQVGSFVKKLAGSDRHFTSGIFASLKYLIND